MVLLWRMGNGLQVEKTRSFPTGCAPCSWSESVGLPLHTRGIVGNKKGTSRMHRLCLATHQRRVVRDGGKDKCGRAPLSQTCELARDLKSTTIWDVRTHAIHVGSWLVNSPRSDWKCKTRWWISSANCSSKSTTTNQEDDLEKRSRGRPSRRCTAAPSRLHTCKHTTRLSSSRVAKRRLVEQSCAWMENGLARPHDL